MLEATVPEGLQVAITVVDNNSSDQIAQIVKDVASHARCEIRDGLKLLFATLAEGTMIAVGLLPVARIALPV